MTGNPKPVSRIAALAFLLALLAAAAGALAGFGTQWGLWGHRTGFTVLRWSAWSGLGVAGIALVAAAIARPGGARRGLGMALAALAIGLVVFVVPWQNLRTARSVPPIHDITTDTENPPAFRDVLPLRKDARNPPDYAGPAVAAQQKQAYPDIAPVMTARGPDEAYRAALAAAADMGWEIVGEAPAEGRIEAVATTFWFGFRDDVVIRVAPAADAGSRIDIRSKSRIGRSDAGANAKRVRAYLSRLERRLAEG